jgi:hypothetical protein
MTGKILHGDDFDVRFEARLRKRGQQTDRFISLAEKEYQRWVVPVIFSSLTTMKDESRDDK